MPSDWGLMSIPLNAEWGKIIEAGGSRVRPEVTEEGQAGGPGPRRDVDRGAAAAGRDLETGEAARCPVPGRHRHLAGRTRGGRRRLGHRYLLQRHAEVHQCPPGTGSVHGQRQGARGAQGTQAQRAELVPRPLVALGLLGHRQAIPSHRAHKHGLCPARSARASSSRRASKPASSAMPAWAEPSTPA